MGGGIAAGTNFKSKIYLGTKSFCPLHSAMAGIDNPCQALPDRPGQPVLPGATLRMEYRSKLLNPKWAKAMANQGSGGAYEISQRMTAMIGWGGTTKFAEVCGAAGPSGVCPRVVVRRKPRPSPGPFLRLKDLVSVCRCYYWAGFSESDARRCSAAAIS